MRAKILQRDFSAFVVARPHDSRTACAEARGRTQEIADDPAGILAENFTLHLFIIRRKMRDADQNVNVGVSDPNDVKLFHGFPSRAAPRSYSALLFPG